MPDMEQFTAAVEETKTAVLALKSEQATKWGELEARFKDLGEAKAASGDVATIRTDLDGLKGLIEAGEKKVDAATAQLESLERKMARPNGTRGVETFSDALGAALEEKKAEITANASRNVPVPIRLDQKAITLASAAQATVGRTAFSEPFHDPDMVRLPQRGFVMRRAFPTLPVGSNDITFAKQATRTLAAATVAEGAAKPESSLSWTMGQVTAQTLAHWFHVSRQALDDMPLLQGEIESEGLYGLSLAEDAQLTDGDGTAGNLSGVRNAGNFTAYDDTALPGVTPVDPVDDLRVARFQVEDSEYFADWAMISREDAAKIDLLKDGDGRYIFSRNAEGQLARPWGLDLIVNPTLAAGEFIVGARMAATIYDRMTAEIAISDQDRDNFITNMYTIRLEERIALAVKRPGAIVSGSFTVPAP